MTSASRGPPLVVSCASATMEYLQVKTPFIEKWEKEVLVQQSQNQGAPDLLSQYIDFNKLQDFTSSSVAPPSLPVDSLKKPVTPAPADAKKRKKEEAKSDETSECGEVVRKELHNAVEKRRRDKINTIITELKELVPNCRHYTNNKATVLHHAAEHIKMLSQQNQELNDANRRLQESNAHLIAELTEMHRVLWGHHQHMTSAQPGSLLQSALHPFPTGSL